MGKCAQPVFIKLESTARERVRFQYIATCFEESCVNLFNNGGLCEHKIFIAALGGLPTVVLGSKLIALYICAHGTIIDDDLLCQGFEKLAHKSLQSPPGMFNARRGIALL